MIIYHLLPPIKEKTETAVDSVSSSRASFSGSSRLVFGKFKLKITLKVKNRQVDKHLLHWNHFTAIQDGISWGKNLPKKDHHYPSILESTITMGRNDGTWTRPLAHALHLPIFGHWQNAHNSTFWRGRPGPAAGAGSAGSSNGGIGSNPSSATAASPMSSYNDRLGTHPVELEDRDNVVKLSLIWFFSRFSPSNLEWQWWLPSQERTSCP